MAGLEDAVAVVLFERNQDSGEHASAPGNASVDHCRRDDEQLAAGDPQGAASIEGEPADPEHCAARQKEVKGRR